MGRVEKHPARASRSRPVSCQFCRSRKLRCSRQFPCPNCTSRGIPCQVDVPSVASTAQIDETPDALPVKFQHDVLARLSRLEELVVGKGEPTCATSNGTGSRPSCSPRLPITERSSNIDVDWLEGEVTYPGSTNSLLSYEIEFKTCSIKEALLSDLAFDRESPETTLTRCIWLPLYEESKHIVDKYLVDITYIHHVVHIASVRKMVDELYQNLNNSNPVKLGQVSLLLAILASTTFFWTERDTNTAIFSSAEEANGQATTWMKTTLDVLEYSRRTRSDSLEDIQAMVIVSFVICNIVGITSQVRYIFSMAISVARQLSLHRIDHPDNTGLDVPDPSSIRAEMGRRVWWYLVATDWQVSQFAGPQKGTYTIYPQHMATNKPINFNDEDLGPGMPSDDQPISQPTSMSYCLQRIRLGELCREISDSLPFGSSGAGAIGYQQIREIDARMCDFANGMPGFFSLDYTPSELPPTDPRTQPGIIIQRYVINSLIYTQRCRLHLPYLSRAATEPTYAYSREAALEAARMVIRTERQVATEKIPFVLARFKFSGGLHCMCMAIIVLLMDVCLNKSVQSEDDRERREEIFYALGILEEARGHSPFPERLLDSFYGVLRRHNILLSDTESRPNLRPRNDSCQPCNGPEDRSTLPNESTETNTDVASLDPALPAFDDFWQTFDTNMDAATLDWSTLFSELEHPFMSM